jgi:hypothetical protein
MTMIAGITTAAIAGLTGAIYLIRKLRVLKWGKILTVLKINT